MSLHVDRYAYKGVGESGVPLLLIHGWGMHGGMWGGVAEQLSQHSDVLAVDLPGHGFSAVSGQWEVGSEKREEGSGELGVRNETAGNKGGCSHFPLPVHHFLDAIVDELSLQFNEPLNLCGWSLGGQVALRWAARHPQQVQRLLLVASTPCFVRSEEWAHAMSVEMLQEFASALQQNYAQTLKRFLALQLRGSEQERELLSAMRATLFSRGEPDLQALQDGLAILRDGDLRMMLPELTQTTLIVAGDRDALTPWQASQYMAQQIPHAELVRINGAAHAPFLSHPNETAGHMIRFLHG